MANVDPYALEGETYEALRLLRGTLNRRFALAQDAHAYQAVAAADLNEAESRTAAEKAWKQYLRSRPWRGKIVRRADGSRTVSAKTYTDHGVVVIYGNTVKGAAALVEAIEGPLAPFQTRPTEMER